MTDTVKAAQLSPDRIGEIGKRLGWHGVAVG
jgi:hypothetical protein